MMQPLKMSKSTELHYNNLRKHRLRIIVEGGTGTGKTTIARVIHDLLKGAGVPTTLNDSAAAARGRLPIGITLSKLGAAGFYEDVEVVTRNSGKPDPGSFAWDLYEWMRASNYTQQKAAYHFGVSQRTVFRWLHQENIPHPVVEESVRRKMGETKGA